MLLYYYVENAARDVGHWTVSEAIGRPPFALVAYSPAATPNHDDDMRIPSRGRSLALDLMDIV